MAKAFLFFGVMLSCLIACGNENTGAGPDISMDSAKYYNPAISYGTLKDSRDGQVYRTVQIGMQTWMAENLNYDYNVGTAASYCNNNSKDSCAKYGRLYTWSAAMDSAGIFSHDGNGCGYNIACYASGKVQGVCPAGWHLPDTTEWNALIMYGRVTAMNSIGYALKSTNGWMSYNGISGNGSDEFGFGALPAGHGSDNFNRYIGFNAYFWASTEEATFTYTLGGVSNLAAYSIILSADRTIVGYNNYSSLETESKVWGLSVRCIKD